MGSRACVLIHLEAAFLQLRRYFMYKYTFKTRPHQLDNDVPLPKDKGMKKSIPQETLWASPFRTVTTLLGIVELDHPQRSSKQFHWVFAAFGIINMTWLHISVFLICILFYIFLVFYLRVEFRRRLDKFSLIYKMCFLSALTCIALS